MNARAATNSGAMTRLLADVGERLGLTESLATGGGATCRELAVRTGLDEGSVADWLAAMTAAEFVDYNPLSKRFMLRSHSELALSA